MLNGFDLSQGAQIRRARLLYGLSQDKLARQLDISRSRLQQIETSNKPVPERIAKEISAILNVSLTEPDRMWADLAILIEGSADNEKLLQGFVQVLKALAKTNSDAVKPNVIAAMIMKLWGLITDLSEGVENETSLIPDFSTVDLWATVVKNAKHSIKAVHIGSIEEWWQSDAGRRYLETNIKAAEHSVSVQRVFILGSKDDLEAQNMKQLTWQLSKPGNVEIRYLTVNETPSNPPGLLIVDDQLLASEAFGLGGVRDFSVISIAKIRIEAAMRNFESLFSIAHEIDIAK